MLQDCWGITLTKSLPFEIWGSGALFVVVYNGGHQDSQNSGTFRFWKGMILARYIVWLSLKFRLDNGHDIAF